MNNFQKESKRILILLVLFTMLITATGGQAAPGGNALVNLTLKGEMPAGLTVIDLEQIQPPLSQQVISTQAIQQVPQKASSAPIAHGDWEFQGVDTPWSPRIADLVIDSENNIHSVLAGDQLYYGFSVDGTTWDVVVVDSISSNLPAIALDENGNPYIAYHSSGNGIYGLKIAYIEQDQWITEFLASTSANGGWLDIAFDNSGYLNIAFTDDLVGLRYTNWTGSQWEFQVIDSQCQNSEASMALKPDGSIYISYLNGCEGLKIAIWEGNNWSLQVLDSNAQAMDTDIVLDPSGYPHIVYGSAYNIKFAKWDGSKWDISIFDDSSSFYNVAMVLDSDGHPHLVYSDIGEGRIKYAKYSGSEYEFTHIGLINANYSSVSISLNGSQQPQVIYEASPKTNLWFVGSSEVEGQLVWDQAVSILNPPSSNVGVHASIDVDSNGYPHLSYLDFYQLQLRYAYWDGSKWNVEILDQTNDSHDYHVYSSIKVDGYNHPHIAYFAYGILKYAFWDGNSWAIQSVNGESGRYASLAVDSNNFPHIAFCGSGSLKYASWDGNNWTVEIIDSVCGGGDYGAENSLEIDSSDIPHIAYSTGVRDDNFPLRYATYKDNQWETLPVNDPALGQPVGRELELDRNGIPHIAYIFNTNYPEKEINIAKLNGSVWEITKVQDFSTDRVYAELSYVIDSSNNPHLIFNTNNANNIDILKHYYWDGEIWITETVGEDINNSGIYYHPIVAGPNGKLWIAFPYYGDMMVAKGTFIEVPNVSSITRSDTNPTVAAGVDFTVTFSTSVGGVNESDFVLTTTGDLTGASISAVVGASDTYTVTVNTGFGNGTIRLDVTDDDSIIDADSNPLGGTGAGNGDYTSGESYTLEKSAISDFDGDGKSDPVKFYASSGTVWWLKSSTGLWESAWLGSDSFDYVPRSDFDGDGKADPGKYSLIEGTIWYIKSSDSAWEGQFLGTDSYTYHEGTDFDGDGKTDPTKLIPNGAIWYIKSSTDTWEGFWLGPEAFEYVTGDFDGDGMNDPAKFIADPGVLWYWESSTSGWVGIFLGSDAYEFVSGSDFDGDGKDDPTKFYAATGTVWWLKSSTGLWDAAWMGPGSFEFVGGNDFDGDGKTDPAMYDLATGILSWLKSSTGTWDSADMGTDAYEIVN